MKNYYLLLIIKINMRIKFMDIKYNNHKSEQNIKMFK